MTKNTLKHQKDYFNELSHDYSSNLNMFVESLNTFKKFSRIYIKGNVLDIGSGGVISIDISKAKSITLTDIAEDTLKEIKVLKGRRFSNLKKTKNVKTVVVDATKLPFKKDSFDTITMVTTMHHLSTYTMTETQENIHKAMKGIQKALKKDGHFLLVEISPAYPFKIIQDLLFTITFPLFMKIGKPQPYFLSQNQIKELFRNSSFEIIDVKPIPSSKMIFLPLFPSVKIPGKYWDKLLKTYLYIFRKSD